MTKQKIEVGTIVKLKSGGPDMAVKDVITNFSTNQPTGDFRCQWFAGKKLDSGVFPTESLEIVTQEKQ